MALTRFLHFRVVLLRPGTREVVGPTELEADGDLSVLLVEEPAEEGAAGSSFFLFAHATTSYYSQLRRSAGLDAAEVPEDAGSVFWNAVLTPEESATLTGLLSAALAAPAVPEPPPGCDGTWYTLGLETAEGTRGFRWWVFPPAGWEPAAGIVALLVRAAEAALATASPTFADAPPPRRSGGITTETAERPWWRRLLGA